MCSFLAVNDANQFARLDKANYFLGRRGPDATSVALLHGHTFLHNLLSITGRFTPQPLTSEDGSIVCLFNGEIYNYRSFGNYNSDGECIIEMYQKHGEFFSQQFDGEYAFVLYDFNTNKVIAGTDPFRTKPLWVGRKKKGFFGRTSTPSFGFSTYASSLNALHLDAERIDANTIAIFDLTTGEQIESRDSYPFDVQNQHKKTYDDWIAAFEKAIQKRASNTEKGVFIGLSSGYDSGAIAAALLHLKLPFDAYSMYAREDSTILEQRCSLVSSSHLHHLSKEEYKTIEKSLKGLCEPIRCLYKNKEEDLTTSKGSVGIHWVCDMAKQNSKKIQLSGQGADEIFSDYGKDGVPVGAGKRVSDFAGKFPEDLSLVFPWTNFYKGNQEAFLEVNEHVSGVFGIESRYPFLDAEVVQEFLWLTPELKNKNYKAPIFEYLQSRKFPISHEAKTGFSASSNLR